MKDQTLEIQSGFDNLMNSDTTFIVFKHSFTCGISRFVHKQFFADYSKDTQGIETYLVDVKSDRPLSMYIAEKTGIQHESPQVFLFKNGEILYNASHHSINYSDLKNALDSKVA